MMNIKNYEFCEDIWREIKSYMFIKRTRGHKCDCCDNDWVKCFAIRDTDVWWEGKQIEGHKIKSVHVPIKYGDFPAEVNIGTQNQVKMKHYCGKCWVKNVIGFGSELSYLNDFIRQWFSNRFLNVVENNKKNKEIVDKIQYPNDEENWLIKKHRLIATRDLQSTAIQILEEMIKDFNKIVKEKFDKTKKEYKEKLEERKWKATQLFYTKMEVERFNRDLIKKFEQGEIKYPEFVRLFKK